MSWVGMHYELFSMVVLDGVGSRHTKQQWTDGKHICLSNGITWVNPSLLVYEVLQIKSLMRRSTMEQETSPLNSIASS
jgi:hypothetical protein